MIEALYEATSPSDGNNNGGRDSGVGRNTTGGTPTAARRPAWCASKVLTAKEPDFTPWLKSLKKGTVDDRRHAGGAAGSRHRHQANRVLRHHQGAGEVDHRRPTVGAARCRARREGLSCCLCSSQRSR